MQPTQRLPEISMAPNVFSKLFAREKRPLQPPRRLDPDAIGVLDSTCAINSDPTNKWVLPIPSADGRRLSLGTHPRNPQHQSSFFRRLPREIRGLIYLELLGGQRIHIDHVFRRPMNRPSNETKLSAKKGKRKQKQQKPCWQWWHHICQRDGMFLEDRYWDRCASWVDETMDARQPGWTGYPPGMKIAAVQWLRCCQMSYEEALPILYTTNVFNTGPSLDTPFHMSRLLLPEYTSLITSMDISFQMTMPYTAPPDLPSDWATVYPAFFAMLDRSFPHVHRLRLTLGLKPWHMSKVPVTDESLDVFLAPWEKLASGRTWTQLDLCVPCDWYDRLREKAEAQSIWTLKVTVWGESVSLPCFFGR